MVRPEFGDEGREVEVRILGENYGARVVAESPFDPENARLRG
jgi:dimethylglycine dehydrogenase